MVTKQASRILALALLGAGCGQSGGTPTALVPGQAIAAEPENKADAAAGRLAPGTECVVRVAPPADPAAKPDMIAYLQDVAGEPLPPMLAAGTKVRVASDERPAKMGQTDPPDADGVVDHRWVQVQVLEGEHKGKAGLLARSELRAIK